jgi:hypothetical protein
MTDNLPYRIKFTIFNPSKKLTKKQKDIKYDMIMEDSLKIILQTVFDRAEPSICSINEKKQLRLSCGTYYLTGEEHQHYLHFNQSSSFEYFTIEELRCISYKIKNGLEEFLHHEIDTPVLYIEL